MEKREKVGRLRDLVIGTKENVPAASMVKVKVQSQQPREYAGMNILDEDRDEDI